MQLGVSPGINDAPEEFFKNKLRAELFRSVEDLGFETIHAYEDVSEIFCPTFDGLSGSNNDFFLFNP